LRATLRAITFPLAVRDRESFRPNLTSVIAWRPERKRKHAHSTSRSVGGRNSAPAPNAS
jgi:hypothetical protein